MIKFFIVSFLFFLLLVFLLGFSFVRTLGRVLFGVGSGRRSDARRRRQESQERSREASKKKKVFEDSEGEYVDYVEVKED